MDLEKYSGLSSSQALEALKKDGYNELPSQKEKNVFSLFFGLFKEPMLLLLVAAGTIYLLLGEPQDSLMLLTAIFVVIGITFYQERKTEKALQALKNLSSPRALVIRSGEQKRIPGREVVVNDILILREGDRVPADAIILSQSNLMVDESLLTGESLSVSKKEWSEKEDSKNIRPGGDNTPFVFSGTLIINGHGVARVTKIGTDTEMGKIGKSLTSINEEETLLKKETNRLVKLFGIVGLILCFLVIILYGLTRGDWLNGLLAGLTLSMSLLPEEFPVVLLVFLTLGAWRISKNKVLTRNTAAIETFGAINTLCVDKTGTLTHNRMELSHLYDGKNQHKVNSSPLPKNFHILMEYAYLASQKDPFDPIEKEIKEKSKTFLEKKDYSKLKIVKEYCFSKHLFAISHLWEEEGKKEKIVAAKGAPETIFEICHLSSQRKKELEKEIEKMSSEGLRLIAVAKATWKSEKIPDSQHDFAFEFLGLLGFSDPVRSTVTDSIKECYRAGIRVCMITGDYPGTAVSVAKQIGLKNPDEYLTGPDLEKLDHLQLREKIKTVNVFARVMPEQKLSIVNALKANGEIVAMTGDGVNDAPSLKSANVGIAMGERGTDVARETGDLVLLDDNFSSIVNAIKMGRKIFDNLKKALSYIFAIHIPIAGMAFFPVLLGMPIVLFPAQIAFLELIIDPACSIVFESEKEEENVMQRPPRDLKEPLFNKEKSVTSFLQGFVVLIIVFAVYLISLWLGKDESVVRTITFATIVFGNLVLIINNLSTKKNLFSVIKEGNRPLMYVLLLAILILGLIIFTPFLRALFHFSPLVLMDFALLFMAVIFIAFWLELLKLIYKEK
jgi:Ca2+-transporting ATPase